MMKKIIYFALAMVITSTANAAQWPIAFINPVTGVAQALPVAEGWRVYYDDATNNLLFYKPNSYGIPTLRLSPSGKIEGMSIQLYEQGDAVDAINLGRAGPDNVQDGNLQTTQPGARIGQICSQTYVTGWDWGAQGAGGQKVYSCTAQIGFRADGTQTSISRPGYLELRATRAGATNVETQMEVRAHNRSQTGSTGIRIRWTEVLNAEGAMDYVVIGPPNSCGSGYRCLRVPN
jgi:hypothetical protein